MLQNRTDNPTSSVIGGDVTGDDETRGASLMSSDTPEAEWTTVDMMEIPQNVNLLEKKRRGSVIRYSRSKEESEDEDEDEVVLIDSEGEPSDEEHPVTVDNTHQEREREQERKREQELEQRRENKKLSFIRESRPSMSFDVSQ